MTEAAKKLFGQAMTLPRDERERLAEALLAASGGDMPPDVEQAWVAEIGRRIGRVRDGEAEAIPWAEARSRLLARLRERRTESSSRLRRSPKRWRPLATMKGNAPD